MDLRVVRVADGAARPLLAFHRGQRHGHALRLPLVEPLPGRGPGRQVRQGLLHEMVAHPRQVCGVDQLPVGVRVAAGVVGHGLAIVGGLALHVHRVVRDPRGLLRGVGLHHELQPLALVERVPGHGPRPHVAPGARDHGLPLGRPAPLERDALPRRAPHVPGPHRRHEPARALPRLGEGARRLRGDPGPGLVDQRRRGDRHGQAPAQALHAREVPQGLGEGVSAAAGRAPSGACGCPLARAIVTVSHEQRRGLAPIQNMPTAPLMCRLSCTNACAWRSAGSPCRQAAWEAHGRASPC
mmetsp:Transcript_94198/g.288178  ORF Transcript_94198/g.288178 Transcript_94198/m.288178 type:complete len:297 (-) Transcript_94198:115-1005(-)